MLSTVIARSPDNHRDDEAIPLIFKLNSTKEWCEVSDQIFSERYFSISSCISCAFSSATLSKFSLLSAKIIALEELTISPHLLFMPYFANFFETSSLCADTRNKKKNDQVLSFGFSLSISARVAPTTYIILLLSPHFFCDTERNVQIILSHPHCDTGNHLSFIRCKCKKNNPFIIRKKRITESSPM